MPTRPYKSALRKEAESETLRRIVAATVELHAEKGAMATTHGEIAERAGVSVPTVYKHFPTRNALLPACMGAVRKEAPVIDAAAILSAGDIDTRLRLLVEAVYTRYRFFHPWIRWTSVDAVSLPEIAEAARAGRQQLESLVKNVLASSFGDEIPPQLLALVLVMLDYPTWQRLDGMLPDAEEVSRVAVHALQLFIAPLRESE
ncbi:MAG: transcriptional regulator, TetR family [Burkholderia sp.]|jgi:AcrR family transcriptional regulator|nr:transcriptional regulator, TetR family [Burkholderia sp.]